MVDGGALELVDANDDKVTREGVINSEKGHVDMVAAREEISLDIIHQGEGWEQLSVKARSR